MFTDLIKLKREVTLSSWGSDLMIYTDFKLG
jgi:hypothetical protein